MTGTYLQMSRRAITGSLLIPVALVLCARLLRVQPFDTGFLINLIAICGFCLVAYYIIRTIFQRSTDWIDGISVETTTYLDQIPPRYMGWAIIAASGLSLYLELIIIRWQSTMFEFFAFYKNFGLLSCFAGLGLGYILSNRDRIPLLMTPILLVWQIGGLLIIRYGFHSLGVPYAIPLDSINVTPIPEQLNMGFEVASSLPHYISIYTFLSVIFLLTVLALVPVGQLCGYLMGRRPAVQAYGLNLVGSLGGVAMSLVLSQFWTPPLVWFIIAFAGILFFMASGRDALLVGCGTVCVGVLMLAWPVFFPWHAVYSPYQLLERGPGTRGLMTIRAEGHFFQSVHDLSTASGYRVVDRQTRSIGDYYDLPYQFIERPERVAIVGAGSGNDVAAAIRASAIQIDAVEIDPAIFQLGAYYHPEAPYSNPSVQVTIDDARSFFRSTENTYDLIIYGLLDSHILLNQASSLRIDSYVYTLEGIREARSRLNEGGVISLTFAMISDEIGRKMYRMMTEAFDGRAPLSIRAGYDGGVVFLQANDRNVQLPPGLLNTLGFTDMSAIYNNPAIHVDLPTDNWPFFYMPVRTYPISYVVLWGLILLLSLILIVRFVPGAGRSGHPAFFFLGAGFMLVETKGITEAGLYFGNTWHVIGIVVMGILIMAYGANTLVNRFKLENVYLPCVLLFASLIIGMLITGDDLTSSVWGRSGVILLLTCPVFFSGLAFSMLLRSQGNIASAMGLNLFGAMCGGILEYNVMYFGFQFLYWLALCLYGIAILFLIYRRPAVTA